MVDQVLTSEEVDAILKITKNKSYNLENHSYDSEISKVQVPKYTYALSDINDALRTEIEKNLSAFLRKKVIVKMTSFNVAEVANCLTEYGDKNVYTVFRLNPTSQYGIFMTNLSFLHQIINLLYGGKINLKDPVIEIPGKVGMVISEKISHICLDSLMQAFTTYGEATYDVIKLSSSFNVSSNLALTADENAYFIVFSVFFDDVETSMAFMISEQFLIDYIPEKTNNKNHHEKDFWKTAMETQIADSIVTINIALPDVNMKIKDFMALKSGDIIPISDPTVVYVCLNSLKLFRAAAGQNNAKRLVKILNQI